MYRVSCSYPGSRRPGKGRFMGWKFRLSSLFVLSLVCASVGEAQDDDWLDDLDDVVTPTRTVSHPTAGSVWEMGQDGFIVQWTLSDADSVRLALYRGDELCCYLTRFIDNDGHYSGRLSKSLPVTAGSDYRVCVEGDNGSEAWSPSFTLARMEFDVIEVAEGRFELTWETISDPVNIHVLRSGAGGQESLQRQFEQSGGRLIIDYREMGLQEGNYRFSVRDGLGVSEISDRFMIDLNGSETNAEAVEAGRIQGDLFDSDEVDVYRIDCAEDREYVFSLVGSPAGVELAGALMASETGSILMDIGRSPQSWVCSNAGTYLIRVRDFTGPYTVHLRQERQGILPDFTHMSVGPEFSIPTGDIADVLKPSIGASMTLTLFKYFELGLSARSQQVERGVMDGGAENYSDLAYYAGVGNSIGSRVVIRVGLGGVPEIPVKEDFPDEWDYETEPATFYYLSGMAALGNPTEKVYPALRCDFWTAPDARQYLRASLLLNFY